jgi:phosphopantetheinyl transferase (holo-ACP synthase)
MIDPTVGTGVLSKCTVNGTDINSLAVQLNYYESIYSPTASCNIMISDASGFHQSANLKGGEDIEIAFGNREGQSIRMKFKTAKITERMRVKENQDMYMLICISQEFLDHNKKAISKAYKKKISDMVKEWHDIYTKGSSTLKKSLVTNEETKDTQQYVGTGRSPIPAIRWAAKEGFSAKSKASNYLYWQDRDGYYFKTIDSMLQEGVVDTLSYAYQNTGVSADPSKVIIAFHQESDFDSMDSSYTGADSTHTYWYDPITGKTGGGKKRDGAGSTTHLGKDPITESKSDSDQGQIKRLVSAPGQGAQKSKFVKSRDPSVVENKRTLPEHEADSAAALQLDNLVMNIRVPGNIKYKAGIKLKLNIPANQEEGELDRRSGDFLVTAVRHVIFKEDKDTKYECILECKSDSHSKKSNGNSGVTK